MSFLGYNVIGDNMNDFTREVIHIIEHIPYGKVMTYGQIAAVAGNPRAARQVSRILHSLSHKYGLPWHRVINAQGKISLTHDAGFTQKNLLICEGIEVVGKQIDLKKHLHKI